MTTAILIVYLALMLTVAWYFSRRGSPEIYFLNARSTNTWLMTFSLVATIIGAGATVAIVSEVYRTGISYGIALPISFVSGATILGLVAGKIRMIGEKYEASSIADFFGKRFDGKTELIASVLQLFVLIIWTAVQAIALASLASVLTGLTYHVALIIAGLVTILYTAMGGLKIDIITDFIQFWIILAVFLWLAFLGFREIGSFQALIASQPAGHLNPFAFGGVQWFAGVILLSGFIYIGNTAYWQRILSAKNETTARNAHFLAIPVLLIISLIVLCLGLIATVRLPGIEADMALFALMEMLLGPKIIGIGFAAMLAVIMSSIDSNLVGGATILYRALERRKVASEKRRMIHARLLTLLFGLLGFLCAFLVPQLVTLSLLVSYLAILFAPACFAALYSKNISADAAFWSLLLPSIVLILAFPLLKENTFIPATLLSILIITLYDIIFRRHSRRKNGLQ